MNFLEKFKLRCKEIDGEPVTPTDEPIALIPKPRYDDPVVPKSTELKRFNIFKQAVPYGANPLNKLIAYNLTRKDADLMVVKLIRKEAERRGPFCENADGVFFSYEIKAMDATPEELSPFYNEGPTCL